MRRCKTCQCTLLDRQRCVNDHVDGLITLKFVASQICMINFTSLASASCWILSVGAVLTCQYLDRSASEKAAHATRIRTSHPLCARISLAIFRWSKSDRLRPIESLCGRYRGPRSVWLRDELVRKHWRVVERLASTYFFIMQHTSGDGPLNWSVYH